MMYVKFYPSRAGWYGCEQEKLHAVIGTSEVTEDDDGNELDDPITMYHILDRKGAECEVPDDRVYVLEINNLPKEKL